MSIIAADFPESELPLFNGSALRLLLHRMEGKDPSCLGSYWSTVMFSSHAGVLLSLPFWTFGFHLPNTMNGGKPAWLRWELYIKLSVKRHLPKPLCCSRDLGRMVVSHCQPTWGTQKINLQLEIDQRFSRQEPGETSDLSEGKGEWHM